MKLIQHYPEEYMYFENSAILCGSSLVYDLDFEYAHNCHRFHQKTELLEEEVARRLIRIERTDDNANVNYELRQSPKVLGELFELAVPFNLTHPYNWFHFLIESMPTLLDCIIKGLIYPNSALISGRMHINMLQLLDLLFERKVNVFQIELMQAMICRKILVSKKSFEYNELRTGKMFRYFHFDGARISTLRKLIETRTECLGTSDTNQNIFVIRNSSQRNVINLAELVDIAKDANYQIIDPGLLSLYDQIRLFSGAKKIVGPTGAWLANLLFANRDCCVSVLYPSTTWTDLSMWKGLGDILGISVRDYYFDVPSVNEYQPIHSNFLVDVEKFRDLLSF